MLALLLFAQAVEFTHGVASGQATDRSVILWTRVSAESVVVFEIAREAEFGDIAWRGEAIATEDQDFTVKLTAPGLEPGRAYWYRALAGKAASEIGRFRTAPAPDELRTLRFAFSGDSDGTRRFYNSFEVLDAVRVDEPDFFLYIGDTVYADSQAQEPHAPARTIDEYRALYKENRSIDALRRLMAATSFFTLWSDHEVRNDYQGATVNPELYAAGRRAFLDYMPVDEEALAEADGCAGRPLFRSFRWGAGVEMFLLDGRSCRTADAARACPFFFGFRDPVPSLAEDYRRSIGMPVNPARGCLDALRDPSRTMLGAAQKALLMERLRASAARWKLIVTEAPAHEFYLLPYDRWEGYAAEREELLRFVRDNGIRNVVFLTADSHANFINDVRVDGEAVAKEFVTGPIAAGTMQQSTSFLGAFGRAIMHRVLDFAGPSCRNLDSYSYGLVEIEGDRMRVMLKSDRGETLRDQLDETIECVKVVEAR